MEGETTPTNNNTVTNVAAGKPKVGGSVYVAPAGTTLPTDATTALASAFKCLGYVSEDGLTNTPEMSTELIKSWGGDVVLAANNGMNDNFGFTLIEVLNEDVLKFVYGPENVSGALSTGLTVKAMGVPNAAENVLVVETVLRGAVKRIVIPRAVVTAVAEIVYRDNAAVGYDTTVAALPGTDGATHTEYIKTAT